MREMVLQCSVNEIGGEEVLSSAERCIDHSHGKLQQQGGDTLLHPHLPFQPSPVAPRIFSIQ